MIEMGSAKEEHIKEGQNIIKRFKTKKIKTRLTIDCDHHGEQPAIWVIGGYIYCMECLKDDNYNLS